MTPGIFHSSGIFVHGMNGRYQSPGLPPSARTRAASNGVSPAAPFRVTISTAASVRPPSRSGRDVVFHFPEADIIP
jgi:hypothetical protein